MLFFLKALYVLLQRLREDFTSSQFYSGYIILVTSFVVKIRSNSEDNAFNRCQWKAILLYLSDYNQNQTSSMTCNINILVVVILRNFLTFIRYELINPLSIFFEFNFNQLLLQLVQLVYVLHGWEIHISKNYLVLICIIIYVV